MKNDIKYMDEHIAEEIEGAECYMNKAMEYKEAGNMEYTEIYLNMALQELGHADMIMKMQDECVKEWDDKHPSKEGDNVYKDVWESYRKDRVDKYNILKDKINKSK